MLHMALWARGFRPAQAAFAATGLQHQAAPFIAAPAACLSAADFIQASPLLPSCGITDEQVEAELGRWEELGAQVARNLGFPAVDRLDAAQRWVGGALQPPGVPPVRQLHCGQPSSRPCMSWDSGAVEGCCVSRLQPQAALTRPAGRPGRCSTPRILLAQLRSPPARARAPRPHPPPHTHPTRHRHHRHHTHPHKHTHAPCDQAAHIPVLPARLLLVRAPAAAAPRGSQRRQCRAAARAGHLGATSRLPFCSTCPGSWTRLCSACRARSLPLVAAHAGQHVEGAPGHPRRLPRRVAARPRCASSSRRCLRTQGVPPLPSPSTTST